NVWAADVVVAGLSVEEALRNAPEQRADSIVVPKVVE
ncbi:MAG: Asp-tRNA(Asn)/Glu-tRNA(Gln) amidotransferase GatCAB subunit C, partial [Opitutaceae bacterium]|nr:Asp-tRNA(Asn)/Glu-tRNA(Gln) amidotransferase GatCAB subunit C [Opitutaceae bacterium]